MTAKTIFNKIKSKFVLLLALICVFTFSAFLFTGCGEDETDKKQTDITYTKQETDTADIKNGSFEFGLADVDISDFPLSSSITGWSSVSAENSSNSSKVVSGVIDTNAQNYKKTLAGMLDNSTFLTYVEKEFNFKRSQIVADKATENADKSESEIEELADNYIVETYLLPAFPNPGTREGASGTHVLMLNNYTDEPWHTAQSISSSSTLDLVAGTYGKISFYVNAKNLVGFGDYFLNVRLEGTLDGATQAPYVLKGIKNTDGWKQYSVYVKVDAEMATSVNVSFGLGYCDKEGLISNNVKGTAFIDDVVYEEISSVDYDQAFATSPLTTSVFTYNSEKVLSQSVEDKFAFTYSMVANEMDMYDSSVSNVDFSASNYNVESGYVHSNAIDGTTVDKFGAENSKGSAVLTDENKAISFNGLLNASYFAKITNPSLFKVSNESYFYLSFDVENKLNRLNSTDVSVFVIDSDGKEHLVGNYNTPNETTRCHLLVKNNTPITEAPSLETFEILIVVGLTDITKSNIQSDFATGSVKISNATTNTGFTYQYQKNPVDGNVIINPDGSKNEVAGYDFYSYLNAVSTSVALDQYSKDEADTYYLSNANSAQNSSFNKVASINGFTGVEPDHSYLNEQSTKNAINDRIGAGNEHGVAGLINSKYINNYSDFTTDEKASIKSALNYSGEKSIQPIMIYNKTENAYGFLGTSFTVAESAYASISVKVRVTGNAKAFIYLVDTSKAEKTVAELSFEKGNVATDATYDKAFSQKLSFEGITASNMNSDGWLTLTFYVANGANAKNLRLELWNGSRDNAVKSQGYVFFAFDSFTSTEMFSASVTSSAFSEPATLNDAYTTKGNPLFDNAFTAGLGRDLIDNAVKYVRELDAIENKYNSEDPDVLVSYDPTYVWANALTTDGGVIYAVYNTIDPVAIDPYANDETEEEEETGCSTASDPSTFWLSFSSIVLGVVIVFALLALIFKQVRRRRIANRKDGVSHYKVTSRIKTAPKKVEKKVEKEEDYEEDDLADYNESVNETEEEPKEEPTEETTETEEKVEETSDEYVYGDVQDFGDDQKTE